METNLAQYEAIINRLGKLERQNKRLKFVGLVSILGMLILGTVAWTSREYTTYQGQFILRDKLGNVRGGMNYDGNSNLGSIWLGGVADNTGEHSFRPQTHFVVDYDNNGNPYFAIYGKSGKKVVTIAPSQRGHYGIWIYDEDGNTLWQAIK